MNNFKVFLASIPLVFIYACSHPIEIVGEGDVTSTGGRICTLENYQGALDNCTKNYVVGAYQDTYTAEPRVGWLFDHWGNYCHDATGNECSFNIGASTVKTFWGQTAPPLRAVFSRYKVTGPILPNIDIQLGTGFWDISAVGYQKREFFIAGTANSFTPDLPLPSDGKLVVTADPLSADGYFKTRVVTIRPIDPADFNGTVIVEWLNVTAGGDSPPDWLMAHNHFIRDGYAWVGVSAQWVGVNALKNGALPARYASLVHPTDSYSYNMFSQVGMRVADPASVVLGGLTAQRVIATGESQSASRMVTYIDAAHPIDQVYDGFMVHSRGSSGSSIAQSPLPSYSFPSPAPIRDDLNVPVMVLMAEGDVIGSNLNVRQPDTAMFRQWEMAGTSHTDAYTIRGLSDPNNGGDTMDMFGYLRAPTNPFGCTDPINAGPQNWIVQAAFKSLDHWVKTIQDTNVPVVAPPQGTPLADLSSSPVVLDRDTHGNALGGVRSPHVDVPLATLDSVNSAAPGGFVFCRLFGRTVPFTPAEVLALYPTKADFLTPWINSLNATVANGFMLQVDADNLEAAANAWQFPD